MTASSFGSHGEPEFKDTDAPDVALNPTQAARYAGLVGNRRIGTTAQRNAALTESPGLQSPGVWEKLRWGDTTDGVEYELNSGQWTPLTAGANLFSAPSQATAFAERGNTMTAATCSVTVAAPSEISIFGTGTAQSDTSMTNWAANLMLFVNNVQVGGYTRIRNQAKADMPLFVSRYGRALLAKGANTIQLRVSVDSGSDAPGRLYLVNPQIEVFRG